MEAFKTNLVVDARGLACPMPIVRTKKAMNALNPGGVVEVQATDKGSKADIEAWSKGSGHQYLGTIEEEGILKHYIRKASVSEEKSESKFPHVISNEDLVIKLENEADMVVLDVREPAEFAFGHIPQAVSIPFADLEVRLSEIDQSKTIYVVCRTGNRSDMAAQILSANGFSNVVNVVPGMTQWTGETDGVK
ncbi:sulfurtransferase TusA family protein [Cytobacillus spongiae]|jgi:rhodanese-related sulfurtransferase/TusA-related sulfurtransferase|uniref:sulfurtransferase TusA family protein n=1 Tax=Cytobacillus spongiae TaxID=2901381 RepID=UPI001F2227AF|nr:sulfurtransferase TusA family protein [Cytobacillus spongiae]UII56805.1 sulfurtransferase TusA family protein [Cytobacillus spongiae]